MDDSLVTLLGFIALPVTGSALIASITVPVRDKLIRRRELIDARALATVEHELREALDDLLYVDQVAAAKPVNYRHNIHCPTCGRFSKRVLGQDNIVECKAHGVLVRWRDIPTNFVSTLFVGGTTLRTDTVTFMSPLDWVPITEPIDIIVPDDISELLAIGAVI